MNKTHEAIRQALGSRIARYEDCADNTDSLEAAAAMYARADTLLEALQIVDVEFFKAEENAKAVLREMDATPGIARGEHLPK